MSNQNYHYYSKRHSLNYDIYGSSTLNDYVIQKDDFILKQQGQIDFNNNFKKENKQNLQPSNGAIHDLLKLYDNKKYLNFNSTIKKDKKIQYQNQNYNKNGFFITNSYNQQKNKPINFSKPKKQQEFDRLKIQIQMLIKQNKLLKAQNQQLIKELKARKGYSLDLQNQNKRLKQKLQQNQQIQIKLANFKLQFQSQSYSQQILIAKLQKQRNQSQYSGKRHQQIQKKQINQLTSLYQNKLSSLKEQLQFNKNQHLHEIENIKTLIQCKYQKIIIANETKYQEKVKQLEYQLKMKQQLLQQYKKYVDEKKKMKENYNFINKNIESNNIQLKIQI